MPQAHEALWARLRNLPPVDPSLCWVPSCSPASRAHSHLAIGLSPIAQQWAINAEAKQLYGHIWRSVETFYLCVVLEGLIMPPSTTPQHHRRLSSSGEKPLPLHRHVLVPSRFTFEGKEYALFRELPQLFSGFASRLTVVRSPDVIHCPPFWEQASSSSSARGNSCCHNTTYRNHLRSTMLLTQQSDDGGTNTAHHLRSATHEQHSSPSASGTGPSGGGSMDHHLKFAEMRSFQGISHTYLKTMRHVVWGNLGIGDEATHPADTVLFVSNVAASNARRIANESGLADVVREVVRQVKPEYRFRYQRLESLSYTNELKLLRRTAVLISLFGSSLHNCRFLPEGAIVLQIHGALKAEVGEGSAYQFRDVCERAMGLKWAAFAADGWSCNIYNRMSRDGPQCAGAKKWKDFSVARVPPHRFGEFVRSALQGDFTTIHKQYEDALGEASRQNAVYASQRDDNEAVRLAARMIKEGRRLLLEPAEGRRRLEEEADDDDDDDDDDWLHLYGTAASEEDDDNTTKPPCTQQNKQKALYLQYDFEPSLKQSPATDIRVEHQWNSTGDLKRYGKKGVYAAQPIGTGDGVGGYFGSQVHGLPGQTPNLLFSIWDALEKPLPSPRNITDCLHRGGPNVTWCEHKHSFALSSNCYRHCLDCGLHKGWHNTTGVQCHVQMPNLKDGDVLRFRLRRVENNATFDDPTQGLGLTYKGSVWELTARQITVGVEEEEERSAAPSFVVGRMFWERTYSGITRFGAFHEHIGCCPCEAFYESEVRTGPWVTSPMPRPVKSIGFTRKQVQCQRYEVAISPADPKAGRPYPSAQFRTGPGTGP